MFDAFTALADDPAAPDAQEALDGIRSAFDEACALFGKNGYFTHSLPHGARDDFASNDNQPRDGAWDDVTAARRQATLWTLEAQAGDLRRRLETLRDRTGVLAS